jgi:hypothetical protein
MQLKLSEFAAKQVLNTHPYQVWFFACDSRKRSATAVEAHIAKHLADMAARKLGGCVRVGRVVDGLADTM